MEGNKVSKDNFFIFGTGKLYGRYIEKIQKKVNIIGLLDNDINKQGNYVDGYKVDSPIYVNEVIFDGIVILTSADFAVSIKKQLLDLGVDNEKLYFIPQFIGKYYTGEYIYYNANKNIQMRNSKKIALISSLDYSGGAIALINAARLLAKTYKVSIITPYIDSNLKNEIINDAITLVEYPAFLCMSENEEIYIKMYDLAIVNTFQAIDAAMKISCIIPTVWWVHEPSDRYSSAYKDTIIRYPNYKSIVTPKNLFVYGVSDLAKKNFNSYYPNIECGVIPLPIYDYTIIEQNDIRNNEDMIVFAIIGAGIPNKAQIEFIKAAKIIEKKYIEKVKFLIVGNIGDNKYGIEVKEAAKQVENIEFTGLLTQREIRELYKEIDVVVCPSYEETLSISTVEGLMNSKVCIVSKNTGVAEFLEDKKNALICEPGNVQSIVTNMEWIMTNKDKMSEIGKNARKVYEDNFTEEIFKHNFLKILNEVIGI